MPSNRKNIVQPSEWWEAFEWQAKREGLSLSEWIGKHCREALPAKRRDALPERPPANRPKQSEQSNEA